jgi:hypothetical protein
LAFAFGTSLLQLAKQVVVSLGSLGVGGFAKLTGNLFVGLG